MKTKIALSAIALAIAASSAIAADTSIFTWNQQKTNGRSEKRKLQSGANEQRNRN